MIGALGQLSDWKSFFSLFPLHQDHFSLLISCHVILFVMPYSVSVHLEKQQNSHHVMTTAIFNNRNWLFYILGLFPLLVFRI